MTMTITRVTPEQRAEIVKRREGGESAEALAREFGVSASTVKNWHAYDTGRRTPPAAGRSVGVRYTDEFKDRVGAAVGAGRSVSSVAVEFGVSVSTVRKWAVEFVVDCESPGVLCEGRWVSRGLVSVWVPAESRVLVSA